MNFCAASKGHRQNAADKNSSAYDTTASVFQKSKVIFSYFVQERFSIKLYIRTPAIRK